MQDYGSSLALLSRRAFDVAAPLSEWETLIILNNWVTISRPGLNVVWQMGVPPPPEVTILDAPRRC